MVMRHLRDLEDFLTRHCQNLLTCHPEVLAKQASKDAAPAAPRAPFAAAPSSFEARAKSASASG
jgi:hypothetical protein